MRIVYRVNADVSNYQFFLTENEEDIRMFRVNCKSKSDEWIPPEVFIWEPFLKQGDFYQTSSAYLITSPRATELLKDHFTSVGEILPLPYQDEVYGFVNITSCYDCLDKEKTVWRPSGLPDVYVFNVRKLPMPGLFKVSETHRGETLVLINTNSPESDNFILRVEKHGLEGLVFQELWREDD